MSDTQSSIPTYYDARVRVKPCAPDRVPYLPDQVLYLIASALPNPKSVFNFALASKATWENLQPALWKCEVTYESRLGQVYGGTSSDSLQQHFSKYLQGSATTDDSEEASIIEDSEEASTTEDSEEASTTDDSEEASIIEDSEEASTTEDSEEASTTDDIEEASTTNPEDPVQTPPAEKKGCQHGRIPEQCVICGDQIKLENRTFKSPFPDSLLFTDRRLTALHWACRQGPSALPLARNLIRSALVHQPSYIDGVGLRERLYHGGRVTVDELMPGDLPPPLFFAVAYGNVEVCKALINAGCTVNLLQGQAECGEWSMEQDDWKPLMAFKIHKECVMSRGGTSHVSTEPLKCVCQWYEMFALGCETAGHVAIQYEKSEILEILLRGGLDIHLGLEPLAPYSVAHGNMDAIKVLLERDPSLLHRRTFYRPLIHAVPWIEKRSGDDKGAHYERVRRMLEYLLEKGANIDSESDWDLDAIDTEDLPEGGMTALQILLGRARVRPAFVPWVMDSLTAAEVFIRAGANWNRPISSSVPSEGLLECSLVKTVGIFSGQYPMDGSQTVQALEIRKCWGRVVKAMIETASQSQSDADKTTANGANIVEEFSNAFTYLVNYHVPGIWPNRFGPWGTEAVGKLLLSTGITPSPEDMEKWKILCLNREAWISEDGDRSQWEFLLAGVDAEQFKIE